MLPAIAANEKVLRAFRRFLTKHEIEPPEESVGAAAPVSPTPAETGHGLSGTVV